MRKRKEARRLWLGDWQQGQPDTAAEPDQGDTFVVLPADESDVKWRAERRQKMQRRAAIAAAVAVFVAAVIALDSGGNNTRFTAANQQVPPAQAPQAQPQLPQTPQVPQGGAPGGFGGADLTGAAATKAAKAALDKFSGDIERVTAGPGGRGYVVHVFLPDGMEVHVLVSDEFKVLGSDAAGGGRAPGFGGGAGASPYGVTPTPQGGSPNPS
jgi:hypothetical protein